MAPIRELTTLGDLDRAVTGGATSMLGWRVADLDLSTRGARLTGLDAPARSSSAASSIPRPNLRCAPTGH